MMAGRDLRDALPWLEEGPVRTANQRAGERLVRGLREAGYRCVELEGERVVGRASFLAQLSEAMGAAVGSSWDDLRDRGPALAGLLGERTAIVWHRADHSAFFSLRTVVEAVHELLGWREELRRGGADLEVVLLGAGREFPQPEGSS